MTADEDLPLRSAVDLAGCVHRQETTAEAVFDAHLDRIARYEPQLNAFITLCEQSGRAQARAIDAKIANGEHLGQLAGVPVGVKDVTETAGIRTTYGSKMFADFVPTVDAVIVDRLKQSGAVILGKTNTPEFATGASTAEDLFGASRNPWNTDLSVGASSGAGAAALASGMIGLASGTDLGGSLRVPAAFCGVVGLRPTPGLVASVPNRTPFDSLDVDGLMARSARDLALGLSVVAGPDPGLPGARLPAEVDTPTGLRLAFARDIANIGVDREIASGCQKAAQILDRSGHAVEEIAIDWSQGRSAYVVLRGQWMINRHFHLLDRRDEMGPILARSITAGLEQAPREIAHAESVRTAIWREAAALFQRYDALLTPTTAIPPFPVEHGHPTVLNGQIMETYIDWAAPTFLISLVGLPAISVPCGLTEAGLPVGLQITGPRFSEARLLALAAAVEGHFAIGLPPLVAH